MSAFAEVGSSLLLFFLVFGMSATVEIKSLRKAIRNRNALLTGITLQFVILPFLGFCVVKLLDMDAPMGVTLLVITSSPGGSYSNWWCSIFNAELALSVTMTTISTLLSVLMLPVNLILYTSTSYSSDVVKSLDFFALFWSLITVIGGIATGLMCSWKIHSHKFNRIANKLGNLAGVSLITFSAVVSSESHDAQVWDQPIAFYFGIALPCFAGLVLASVMVSYFKLEKPERVAVAVECCYQNTGIATSVAINMFSGDDLATAVSVPLFYGMVEAVLLAFYCLGAWKSGWTKAPADESICVVIATSYEVRDAVIHDPEAIEIVLGSPTERDGPHDLIFSATSKGHVIDEESLHAITEDGDDNSHPIRESDEAELHSEGDDDGGDSDHEVIDLQNGDKKRKKAYAPLEVGSPSLERNAMSSDDIIDSLPLPPPVGGDDELKSVSSSGSGGRIGRAVAKLARGRGAGKYHQASSISEQGEEGRDAQNFNFPNPNTPDSSPQVEKSRTAVDLSSIPVSGKTLD